MTPGQAFGWFLHAWMAAVVALVAFRLLTGRIALAGLLTQDGDKFSPERLQLLLATIGALVAYAAQALDARAMPADASELLILMAGSNALYLGGKFAGR
jgi:hypothetical protein